MNRKKTTTRNRKRNIQYNENNVYDLYFVIKFHKSKRDRYGAIICCMQENHLQTNFA